MLFSDVGSSLLLLLLGSLKPVAARLTANETDYYLFLENDRLSAKVNKSMGAIDMLVLDGQDLLGSRFYVPSTPGGSTGDGQYGIGPYLDCYCVPKGFYTPGRIAPSYELFQGVDANRVSYAGVSMSEVYPATGQMLQQFWFLRDGETGLHTFSRLAYHNSTTPFLRNLQEFRTLFRPNTPLWTHLITNDAIYAPLPQPDPAASSTAGIATTVQDATWYLANRTDDPYVEQFSDYFTKYTFADSWRDHKVHGMFSDGSTSKDNATFGSWLVMNTKDTYFGGPTHSDLVVDGIVYNYIVSNHHGDGTPNITDGFDRTFGPQYYHFNRGPPGASWASLRNEAVSLARPDWNAAFYDSIAKHVPNYVPSSGRGSLQARIALPTGASRPLAVLAQDGVDYQDNVQDTTAYQYWADIDAKTGSVRFDRVKAGTYRLTVYADGIFGDYTQDGVVVRAGRITNLGRMKWEPESAGRELWRIGTPDKNGGEWRHGNTPDPTHPLHPPESRIYFGAYDFINDFPDGVRFHVGRSSEAKDWNYIHWSVFGGYGNFLRPKQEAGHGEINNWTVIFDNVARKDLAHTSKATLTIQLAGAKTAMGNTDVFNASEPYSNVPLVVAVNGHELDPWVIPYYHSSSCGVRSATQCYQLGHKFRFPAAYLKPAPTVNEIVLSLPYNATDYESAVLTRSVYVQYDALRLEVE